MSVPPASDFQALLSEDRWIRRLAARLVADASTADDLVQETYLTALGGTSRARTPRAWLSGILRNLWRDRARSAVRRARRELAAARPEASASTDELVAEVELRKRVAELVLELEEPLRRALILRFFKDCSLPALARTERISVSTAHERVERGLAQLRIRLDRAHGGERRSWAVCLAGIAAPPAWTSWITGGTTMTMGAKVAAASLVLAGIMLWSGQQHWRSSKATAPGTAGTEPQSPADQTGTVLAAMSPRQERASTGQTIAPEGSIQAVVATLRGRVLDVRQSPLGGIPIGLLEYAQGRGELEATCASAEDGRFELPLCAAQGESIPVALAPGRATLASERIEDEWRILLTDTAAYSGRVVDEQGVPLAGVELSIEPRWNYFREHGFFRPMDPNQEGWETSSDADGRFALAAAPAGDAIEIRARAAGYPQSRTQVPPGGEGDVRIVLRRSEEGVALTGLVLGPSGEPVAGAHVSTGIEATASGADGSFTVLWRPAAVNSGPPDWTETHIYAVHEDFAPVRLRLADVDAGVPIVLRLRSPLAIRGRVIDTHGEPVAGVVVWPRDPTPLGDTIGGPAASDPFLFVSNLENVLRGGEGVCETAEDGTFELDQLFERAYHVLAFDPRTATCTGPERIEAGASGIVLVLDRETGVQRVAGRLVAAGGEPFAGAMLRVARLVPGDPAFQAPFGELTTDAEGRFEFPALAAEGARLSFFHPEFSWFEVSLESFPDLQRLEIVAPTLCELQIELSDPAHARAARILDGADQPLLALQFRGFSATAFDRLSLAGGKSEVVRLSDTACTLVLYRGEEEVERLPIRLDPDQRTVVRR